MDDPTESFGQTRWMMRSGRVTKPGSRWHRFNAAISWVGVATLTVDGTSAGQLTTERVGQFGTRKGFRETQVSFLDGSVWTISAEEPSGPRPTRRTLSGGIKDTDHPVESRVIVVRDSQNRIAHTDGDLPKNKRDEGKIEAGGVGYAILPARGYARRGRCGATGELSVAEGWMSPDWVFTTSEPLPLSVVLLHWHILMDDRPESSSPGGG